MNVRIGYCLPVFVFVLLPMALRAQTPRPALDSVVVQGRIRNLSARLYRDAPTVLISRTNILQASRELVRPAPLSLDGTFRVALPLIYPQEELFFNYGRIATAFLAAPGTVTIDLNADSLFTAAVPFRFGGANAQVNQQFARFKAFEATYADKPNARKLSEKVTSLDDEATYKLVSAAYQAPFRAFSQREKPFPLLVRWITSANRYLAASFLYEKATYESSKVASTLNDSLRPSNDRILSTARASAMNRFADYAMQQGGTVTSRSSNRLPVRTLASLLLQYGRDLTSDERARLQTYVDGNAAKAGDLRFFDGLIKRSNDTIQRLINYEGIIQRSRAQFDSESVAYITAYVLASILPAQTLDFVRLFYRYAQPQVTDVQLAHSLDELYRLEVSDSVRVRAALKTLQQAGPRVNGVDISSGVFVTSNEAADGQNLFDQVVNANRGRVVYVLITSVSDEAGRQAAIDAQRLRNAYRSRDFALVYVPMPTTEANLWAEFSVKHTLVGDHLVLSQEQIQEVINRIRPDDNQSATVINRLGKIVKRNAPLPGAFEEAKKLIDKNL